MEHISQGNQTIGQLVLDPITCKTCKNTIFVPPQPASFEGDLRVTCTCKNVITIHIEQHVCGTCGEEFIYKSIPEPYGNEDWTFVDGYPAAPVCECLQCHQPVCDYCLSDDLELCPACYAEKRNGL